MNPGIIGQAAGLFAVTNIDDILVLALLFAQGSGHPGSVRRVVVGQYLGFTAILAVAAAAALGASFLPEDVLPYLGLLPLALGLKAGGQTWRARHTPPAADDPGHAPDGAANGTTHGITAGPGVLAVAAVTAANGGDNIGVYVPVFATAGAGGMTVYVMIFMLLVAVWCAAGRFLATRPIIAEVLSRWGHILLPAVLIALGLLILVEGGAFGL